MFEEQPQPQHDDEEQLRIWQQNLNKSHSALLDLIHSANPKDFDIVAIQEPWKSHVHLTQASHRWRVVYPTTHLKSDEQAAATRSVLYINTAISTNAWTTIPVDSPDVSAIELRTARKTLRIFNIYNDCNNDSALDALHEAVERLREEDESAGAADAEMIWLGDFNRHHPTWDEPRNDQLFSRANLTAAEALIDLTELYDMVMTLPAAIPTLVACGNGNLTRVDNVFMSVTLRDSLVVCETRPENRPVKTDHYPVCTTLEWAVARAPDIPRRNFRAVEWPAFKETLAAMSYPDGVTNLDGYELPRSSHHSEYTSLFDFQLILFLIHYSSSHHFSSLLLFYLPAFHTLHSIFKSFCTAYSSHFMVHHSSSILFLSQ